ncbi:hypothetical protein AVEN_128042-1 [Araneus ventricosus]|uniref:Uncharacterized protein n=1 Tax=Araneus ventricosus TaxID=182803 RepID=A0A4Y1ZZC6_ARAVE|nr:hypothetical protein AVEN_128042-1 [Araneus ventricosus]
MTRTAPELEPPLQTSAPQQREDIWPSRYDLTCNRPNTRQMFSGIEFRTWKPSGPKPIVGWKRLQIIFSIYLKREKRTFLFLRQNPCFKKLFDILFSA